MTAIPGFQCVVQIGSTPAVVGNLDNAELNIAGDIYDISAFAATTPQWKSKLGGLASYTIKFSGNFDMSDAQQATLQGDILTNPGTSVTWQIQPKGTGATTKYAGTAFMKQLPMKFPIAGKSTIEFDLDGSGPITFTA